MLITPIHPVTAITANVYLALSVGWLPMYTTLMAPTLAPQVHTTHHFADEQTKAQRIPYS